MITPYRFTIRPPVTTTIDDDLQDDHIDHGSLRLALMARSKTDNLGIRHQFQSAPDQTTPPARTTDRRPPRYEPPIYRPSARASISRHLKIFSCLVKGVKKFFSFRQDVENQCTYVVNLNKNIPVSFVIHDENYNDMISTDPSMSEAVNELSLKFRNEIERHVLEDIFEAEKNVKKAGLLAEVPEELDKIEGGTKC